jgi:hypothetical protein
MRTRLACAALAMIAGSACTDTDSATDLNPEGPPMIRQVRLKERIIDSQGNEMTPLDPVFAFGTHEEAAASEVHPVQTALAVGNRLRIIMDELLVGNHLEEIACRDGSYGRIPVGADPDDIARCSGPNDVLPSRCPASDRHSVCICENPAGCAVGPLSEFPLCTILENTVMVQPGAPVGIVDCNQDGAADRFRFISGAVGIQCGSITVPIDREASYWTPSGTQNKPAMGGFDLLGPAIVLVPDGPMPTDIGCSLSFSPEVVDKQGIQVCAPPNGDVAVPCTPGDVSAFTFGIEPLKIRPPVPAINVNRNNPVTFVVNAPFDPATLMLGGIDIVPTPPGAVTISLLPMTTNVIAISVMGGWAAQTEYAVTFPTTITDTYARPLPQPTTHRFTTGP